nr:MerR family transcriptional regulator [Helicobacter colisuis]
MLYGFRFLVDNKEAFVAYTIIEVEKKTGVSSHTLRFWAKKGLFPFVEKDDNQVKYFSERDVEWVRWINWFRKAQMDIPTIKYYIELANKGDCTAKERREMIARQKEIVTDAIEELQSVLETLEYKLGVYDEMLHNNIDGFNPQSKQYRGCKKDYKKENK